MSNLTRQRYLLVQDLHEVVQARLANPADDFNRGYEMGLSLAALIMDVPEAAGGDRDTTLGPWPVEHAHHFYPPPPKPPRPTNRLARGA